MDHKKCGKFFKRWEYQATLLASWETSKQVKKQLLELDMEEQTGSKEEIKSLLIKVKEESEKSCLKTQHSENQYHGFWSHLLSHFSRVRLLATPWTAAH